MKYEDALNAKVPEANATAYGTGIGNVRVYVDPKTNRTQASGFLPGRGVTVVPDGSKVGWEITGVNPDGTYQSKKVDISGGITSPGATTAGTQSVEDMYGKALNDMTVGQNNLTRMAVNQLESQKKGVHGAFDASARNAYTNYMMNNKNLNEALIRAGLSEGGMSESSQVASNAAYGAELTQNEIGRNQAIGDIDSQIADVKYKGEAALLDAKNNLNLNRIQYYTDKEEREQNHQWDVENAATSHRYDIERDKNQYAHSDKVNARTQARNQAMVWLNKGLMPSEKILLAAGISKEEAQAYIDKVNK